MGLLVAIAHGGLDAGSAGERVVDGRARDLERLSQIRAPFVLSYSGRTTPQSAATGVTVHIRAGAVSVVVLAIAAPIKLQSNSRWACGLQLDIHGLPPFAANPESLDLVVVLRHVDGLCYALEVVYLGGTGRNEPRAA
jgi:hypothetical protein